MSADKDYTSRPGQQPTPHPGEPGGGYGAPGDRRRDTVRSRRPMRQRHAGAAPVRSAVMRRLRPLMVGDDANASNSGISDTAAPDGGVSRRGSTTVLCGHSTRRLSGGRPDNRLRLRRRYPTPPPPYRRKHATSGGHDPPAPPPYCRRSMSRPATASADAGSYPRSRHRQYPSRPTPDYPTQPTPDYPTPPTPDYPTQPTPDVSDAASTPHVSDAVSRLRSRRRIIRHGRHRSFRPPADAGLSIAADAGYPTQPTPQYPAQPTPQYPAQPAPQYPTQAQPTAPDRLTTVGRLSPGGTIRRSPAADPCDAPVDPTNPATQLKALQDCLEEAQTEEKKRRKRACSDTALKRKRCRACSMSSRRRQRITTRNSDRLAKKQNRLPGLPRQRDKRT